MTPANGQPSPFGGVLIVISVALAIGGGLLLAAFDAGGRLPAAGEAPASPTPLVLQSGDVTVILPVITPATPAATATPRGGPRRTPRPSASFVPTVASGAVLPTACRAPAGWVTMIVQSGDTLARIAAQTGTTVEALRIANCLKDFIVVPGQTLTVPAAPPTPLPVATECGPPYGWVFYTVQPGDTLYSIALRHGVTVADLMRANCWTSWFVYVGQVIYVPRVVVATATPSPTELPPTQPPPAPTELPSPPPIPTQPVPTQPAPSATAPPPSPTSVPPSATPVPPTATQPPPTPTEPPPTNSAPPPGES
jgi:LysM repeat protein